MPKYLLKDHSVEGASSSLMSGYYLRKVILREEEHRLKEHSALHLFVLLTFGRAFRGIQSQYDNDYDNCKNGNNDGR